MTSQRKSLLDILKQRQREQFVGRSDKIALFDRNFTLPLEHRKFIFNLSGQGGVGKTFLLRRYRQIAESAQAITAWADETESDIPMLLGHIAFHLEQQDHVLKRFNERFKIYRQRRQELESDPDAPQGLPGFIGRTLTKAGMHFARRAPGVGVAFEFIDEDSLATQAGDWINYIAKKLGNKDEVLLVQEPVEVLTPLFLEELHEVAEEGIIALFFDTYERTSEYLDEWLRGLLEERFGDVPSNLLILIAGQHELDRNCWAPYEELIARLPLEPFSENEALDYLSRKGIVDDKLVQIILNLSGRLPLLVATLASESPGNSTELGDPSGTAVERFLKWVADAKRRQVAMEAALPRQLNRDVLAVIVGEQDADTLFNWLKGMPFVDSKRLNYHSVVRSQMLRHIRRESPQHWADLHAKFAGYYESLKNHLDTGEKREELNASWQSYTLDTLYHNLCGFPHKKVNDALNGFVFALDTSHKFAGRWAETIEQAGVDSDSSDLQEWGKNLRALAKAVRDEQYDDSLELLGRLSAEKHLDQQQQASVLLRRANIYSLKGQIAEAIPNVTSAIQLSPENLSCWMLRGDLYRRSEDYKNALADFTHIIELDEYNVDAIAFRGETFRLTGKYKRALVDFDRALDIDPKHHLAVLWRGSTCRQLKRFEEALDLFDYYIELKPKNEHHGRREIGITLEAWGKHEEAVENFISGLSLLPTCEGCWKSLASLYRTLFPLNDVAEKLRGVILPDVDSAEVITSRAAGLGAVGLNADAIADLTKAIELERSNVRSLYLRAYYYLELKRYEEALADCNLGLSIAPTDGLFLSLRGEISQASAHHEEALEDLKHAVELKPDLEHVAQKNMGLSLHALNKYNEASRAFIRALAAQPECVECWFSLGKTLGKLYPGRKAPRQLRSVSVPRLNTPGVISCRASALRDLGFLDEALEDFTRAIKLNVNAESAYYGRGKVYLKKNLYTEAINDFTRAINLAPTSESLANSLKRRADAYYKSNHLEEALVDINRAIELDRNNLYYIKRRGEVYQWLGQYDNALADFQYVSSLHKDTDETWDDKNNTLGLVLSYLGRYAEAVENYEQELKDDPDSYTSLYNLAVTKSRWQGALAAEHLIQESRGKLKRLLHDANTRGHGLYGLGGLEALVGNSAQALSYLEQAIYQTEDARRWAPHDIAWNDLRADESFQRLVRQEEIDAQ